MPIDELSSSYPVALIPDEIPVYWKTLSWQHIMSPSASGFQPIRTSEKKCCPQTMQWFVYLFLKKHSNYPVWNTNLKFIRVQLSLRTETTFTSCLFSVPKILCRLILIHCKCINFRTLISIYRNSFLFYFTAPKVYIKTGTMTIMQTLILLQPNLTELVFMLTVKSRIKYSSIQISEDALTDKLLFLSIFP